MLTRLSRLHATFWLTVAVGACSSGEPSGDSSVGGMATNALAGTGTSSSTNGGDTSSTGNPSAGEAASVSSNSSSAASSSSSSTHSSTVSNQVSSSSMGSGGATGTQSVSDTASVATPTSSTGTGGGALTELSWEAPSALWTGVRYYSGGTPNNRTSGPEMGPSREFVLMNHSASEASVEFAVTGADADRFQLTGGAGSSQTLAAGASASVTLSLITDNSLLPAAPAQDDGATVFSAELVASSGSSSATLSLYALVLTYVELEPTFGQIMAAFPYRVDLGDALENDANPNPATLPGVEAGTDEVAAPVFQKAEAAAPVTVLPLARFSPPGVVPYGWYVPGNPGQASVVAELGDASDPHTNDQSRMLSPPLASGMLDFDPGSEPFSFFIEPEGQATIYSEDAQNSDGQHRLKVFQVHDPEGNLVANTYLLGGEEAANGDYQDYVFLISNVRLP